MTETVTVKRTTLRSQDLHCPSCVAKIERALTGTAGVRSAKVNFSSGRIVVEHDPGVITPAGLIDVVGRVGYAAKVTAF